MNDDILNTIEDLAISGLQTDGAHHKQWYLEKIVELCCHERDCSTQGLHEGGINWEKGIAP